MEGKLRGWGVGGGGGGVQNAKHWKITEIITLYILFFRSEQIFLLYIFM